MNAIPLSAEIETVTVAAQPTELQESVQSSVNARGEVCVVIAAGLALIAKLVIAWNTFGTNDVVTFYLFARAIEARGLGTIYQTSILFNHPPLTAYYLRWIYELQRLPTIENLGVSFAFLLRLPGIVADFMVVSVLLDLRRRDRGFWLPAWVLILFALSPVSLMVSGYHGNTDPVMVLFLVLAAYFCVREKAFLCGFFFAMSVQVKVIPLLFLPFFLFFWFDRRSLVHFVLPVVLVSMALWFQPLFEFPALFFKNVLSYNSYWGIWGLSYFLRLTGWHQFRDVSFFDLSPAQNLVIGFCKTVIVVMVLFLAWRRRKETGRELWDTIGLAWLFFFVFASGVCTQYLIWLAPFVLVLSPRFYVWLTTASSIFAFIFYDTISHGLPWFRGVSTNAMNKQWTPWTVLPWMILIVGCWLFARKMLETAPARAKPDQTRRERDDELDQVHDRN